MTSKIDVSKIDEFFPVPGINQSTQGFRTNFGEIKRNLLTLKGEVSELLDSKIAVSGDATGTSSTTLGAVGDISIPITLSNTGVAAGTYDVSAQTLSLTVDAKGRITAVNASSRAILDGTKRSLLPKSNNYTGTTTTRSLTIPKLILDQYGNIVDADLIDVGNFAPDGAPLEPGAMWIGGDDRKAVARTPPFGQVQNDSEYWALCMTPFATDLLTWRRIPTGIASPTVVSGGAAIDSTKSGDTFTVGLNVNKLALMGDATALDVQDTLIVYDTSAGTTLRVKLGKVLALGGGNLVDETAPALGVDLDARGRYLYSSTGSLRLGRAGTPVMINDALWPTSQGRTAGSVLTVAADGSMSWAPVPAPAADSGLAPGDGITTGATGVAGVRAVNLSISKLTAVGTYAGTEYVPLLKSDGTQVRVLLKNFLSGYSNILAVDPNGNDSTGTGTFENPYKTITRALAAVPAKLASDPTITGVILGAGIYTENVAINKSKVALSGLGPRDSTTIVGTVSVQSGLGRTYLNRLTVDCSSVNSYSFEASKRSLSITGGVDEFIASDCAFFRTVSYDSDMLENITLSGAQNGSVKFVNCAFRGLLNNALTANGPFGTVELQGVRGSYQTMLGVRNSGARMVITHADYLGDVIHDAGVLEMHNVAQLHGNYQNVIASTANSGRLVMFGCNLYVSRDGSQLIAARINKTGSCDYFVAHTSRNTAQDVLSGNNVSPP